MKPWTKDLTKKFCSEADALMSALNEFRKKWAVVAGTHQKPKGKDADSISDKEADLSDCLDRFVRGY